MLRTALAVIVFAAALGAQTGVGQIQGTITDPTGAVIPNAAVELEQTATRNRFHTTTSGVGFFVFPSLAPGEYQLDISAAGMQKWQGKVSLATGQRGVVDAVLHVSRAAEQVVVAGDVTPLVTTTAPTIATVVERARIEQLPLNGRSIQTLLTITVPGLEGNASQPKVYGLRDSAMEILQDGVNLQDRNTGAIQSRPPGLDTVQEFRVETAVSSAKLDRPASAIISTRSGTNQLHGSTFLTGRNSGFGVARQRQDFFTKAPHLVRNEFGASVGGPVYLPKLYNGKNRTFFFAAWEEFRLRQAATSPSAVWTAGMREGDFSGLFDAQGRRITLYDPWSVGAGPAYTKTPYVGNQIPIGRLSPLAKYIFGVTPLPTEPNINPLVANNYNGLAPTVTNSRTLTFRGDHRLRDQDSLFGRYSRGLNDQMNRRAFSTAGFPITSDNLYNRETYYEISNTAMGSWTHIFTPAFFVESVATLSLINWQYSLNQPSARQNISAQFGTPNPFNVNGAPYINNAGYQGVSLNGIVPRSQYTKIFSGEQHYAWARRNHQIEFGWRYRHEILDTIPDRPSQSTLDFGSMATAIYNPSTGTAWGTQPQTGDNGANFFLGIAGSYSQSRPPGAFDMKGKDVSGYVQDNWKLRRNLTINLGVRWQYLGPYLDSRGMTSVWDFPSKSLVKTVTIQELIDSGYTTKPIADGYAGIGVKWTTPDKAGLPDSMVSVSRRNFSPRLGFAYAPRTGNRSVVLRGGYGMYFFPIPARTFSELRLNPPLQGSYSYSWNNSAQTVDRQANSLLRFAPTVIAGVNSANVLDISQPPTVLPGVQITGLATDLPTARAHEWNLTLESEILNDTVVRAGFVGTAGRKLEMMELFNTNPISNYVWYVSTGLALPQGTYANTARRAYDQTVYGDIRIYSKYGYSNYAGVQLEAERRFRRGLAFQFFYLMSNSTSTGATPSQGGDFTVNGVQQADRFLPGDFPSKLEDRVRFYRYSRDADIPKHRVRFNFLYDLPFGAGKKFAANIGSKWNRVVGGWQIAGYGASNSRYFSLPAANWGPAGKLEVYGKQFPIEDCRAGGCFRGYLYYNGYLPSTVINTAAGVKGVPQNYTPLVQPINPAVPTGSVDANFNNTNNVFVRLKDGTNQLVAYDNGLNVLRNQVVNGPWITNITASVYKSVPLTERVILRFNLDAFNVLNQPGNPTPSGEGIISLRNSAQGARVMQYTARLTW
jgi:carboxypeptidase family protein